MRAGNLSAFHGVVVDECQRIHRDVDGSCDVLDGPGLGTKPDLRADEVFLQAKLVEPCQRVEGVIFAGDGMENAAGIQLGQGLTNALFDDHIRVLEEHTVPEGVIQVPDQTLDGLHCSPG